MSHSLNKIWIHSVWATKNRYPYITSKIESEVHGKMLSEFNKMDCSVKIINGMPDHVHCLYLLNPNHSIADVLKQVKGGSAFAINELGLIPDKFGWQTGYASYSVSESALQRVYDYIKNQKQHHTKKTFENEYNELIQLMNNSPSISI